MWPNAEVPASHGAWHSHCFHWLACEVYAREHCSSLGWFFSWSRDPSISTVVLNFYGFASPCESVFGLFLPVLWLYGRIFSSYFCVFHPTFYVWKRFIYWGYFFIKIDRWRWKLLSDGINNYFCAIFHRFIFILFLCVWFYRLFRNRSKFSPMTPRGWSMIRSRQRPCAVKPALHFIECWTGFACTLWEWITTWRLVGFGCVSVVEVKCDGLDQGCQGRGGVRHPPT